MIDTQAEAFKKSQPRNKPIKMKIFSALITRPMASYELAFVLDISLLSVRPRLSELRKEGVIFDTRIRKKNPSGSNEVVWQLVSTIFNTETYYYG